MNRLAARLTTACGTLALLGLTGSCATSTPGRDASAHVSGAGAEGTEALPAAARGDASLRFEPGSDRAEAGNVKFVAASRRGTVVVRDDALELRAPAPHAVRAVVRFAGHTGTLSGSGEATLPGVSHYYVGSDPVRWRTGVVGFSRVRLPEVYPGVDVLLTGLGGELEVVFLAGRPEALSAVRLEVDGHRFHCDDAGGLSTEIDGVTLHVGALKAFVGGDAGWRETALDFLDQGAIGFGPPPERVAGRLVVDPTLSWSASLQGAQVDRAEAVAAAPDGGFYVAGWTYGFGFPGTPTEQWIPIPAFVARFSAEQLLVWMAFLTGGDYGGGSRALGLAADTRGVWVTGPTEEPHFPVRNALQPALAGHLDAFLAHLSYDGELTYGTFLGGTGFDEARSVALLPDGAIVVGGTTCSTDFPLTPGAADATPGVSSSCNDEGVRHGDGFVAVVNPGGGSLRWSTYLGGSNLDEVKKVAVTPPGDVVATGWTSSADFLLVNAMRSKLNGNAVPDEIWDAFLTRFDGGTGKIVASTFFGGRGWDQARALAVAANGDVVVGGTTNSSDFPVTPGAHDSDRTCPDEACTRSWIALVDAGLRSVKACTFWGGVGGTVPSWGYKWPSALAIAADGGIWAVGTYDSEDLPYRRPLQNFLLGGHDACIGAFTPGLDTLRFSTLLGGAEGEWDNHSEEYYDIASLTTGSVVIAGGSGASPSMPRTAVFGVADDEQRDEHAIVGVISPDGATDLRVTIDGPDELLYFEDAHFTLTVTNAGAEASLDPELFLQEDNEILSVTSPDPEVDCRQVEYVHRCHRPLLAPGESFSADLHSVSSFIVGVTRSRVSEITPQDSVAFKEVTINPATDVSLQIHPAVMQTETPRPGEVVSYDLNPVNWGFRNLAAEDVVVTQAIPPGAHVAAWWSETATCATHEALFRCDFGTVPRFGGPTATVLLELPPQGPVTITANVVTSSPEGNLRNNRAELAIAVREGDATNFHVGVAAVAHNRGATGTVWRTDLVIVNPYASSTAVDLELVSRGGRRERAVVLGPGAATRWRDVAVELFRHDPAEEVSGALHVRATRRLPVVARTYNLTPAGTFGQLMPAVEALPPGQGAWGWVPWLRRTAGFRTNLGHLNLGDTACSGTVAVLDAGGRTVAERTLTVPAGGWYQHFDILAGLGGKPSLGAARVAAPGCSLWSYASIVDTRTGDPTTVPATDPWAAGPGAILPAIAHRPGLAGTVWRTDLLVSRPPESGAETIELNLLQASSGTLARREVPPGPVVEWNNAVETFFGLDAAAKVAGTAFSVGTAATLLARTYSTGAKGTVGQSFSSQEIRRGVIFPTQPGVLPLIQQDGEMRTNVGLVNLGSTPATVRLTLFDASGRQIGAALTFEVGAWQVSYTVDGVQPLAGGPWLQVDEIAKRFGAAGLALGYIVVDPVWAEGIWAYASVIDQRTGDPMTVPLWRLLP